jgi:hypothetical protein
MFNENLFDSNGAQNDWTAIRDLTHSGKHCGAVWTDVFAKEIIQFRATPKR